MAARTFLILACLAAGRLLYAQPSGAIPPASGISDDRILGVIPNFQTVSDPEAPYTPLSVRSKWTLFVKDTIDPYTLASGATGAALSQWHNGAPHYGVGAVAYLDRLGAAQADMASQNFFSDAVLAPLLHEDPRYFREGPSHSVLHRAFYAVACVAVTRKDSGRFGFNFAGIAGMNMGIALSNAYYPAQDRTVREMESRVVTSLTSSAMGNLLPEFWPDIKARLNRFRSRKSD